MTSMLPFTIQEPFFLALTNREYRNKHRRDSNVVKELKGRLQEAAEELMGHVTTILEEGWLPPSDDGKNVFSFMYCLARQMVDLNRDLSFTSHLQDRKKRTWSTSESRMCRNLSLTTTTHCITARIRSPVNT